MTIVDASVVIRMLVSHAADDLLRKRPPRRMHAPALIDAEGPQRHSWLVDRRKTTLARGLEMLNDFAEMLAEKLRVPLLTRDATFGRAAGHKADVHLYP